MIRDSRHQLFLTPDQISREVAHDVGIELSPVEPTLALALVDRILEANRTSDELKDYRIKAAHEAENTWTLENGLLLRYGKLVVPTTDRDGGAIRTHLIKEAHAQPSAAHPGKHKTVQVLQRQYYWSGMGTDVARYVRNCQSCRRANVSRDKTPGLLQPLPVPHRPWQHITMDFTEGPKTKNGFDNILVIVDRLSKRAISVPCHKTVTSKETANLFLQWVYRMYGPPDSIVSDRGPQFVSAFWDEVCLRLGIKLKLSTANHPQTDGQTEVMNQYLKQRLRHFVNYYQDNWDELLPVMDFAQASLVSEATGQSPIYTELGYEPRTSIDWTPPKETPLATEALSREQANERVKGLQEVWKTAREGITKAQERYVTQANKKRRDIDFEKDDMVWVATKHWKMLRPSRKLSEQNAGPFRIKERRGNAFVLDLPDSIKVHPVFNADKLRKAASDPLPEQQNEEPPPVEVDGEHEWEVEKILGVRLVNKGLKYRVQ